MKTFTPTAVRAGRFEQELAANGHLALTGATVPLYTSGDLDNGGAYMVLELQTGGSLYAVVERRGDLSPGEWLDVAIQLCDVVGRVHARGVVHGDLKPANVLLGPTAHLRLADFGQARFTRSLADVEGDLAALIATLIEIGPASVLSDGQFEEVLADGGWQGGDAAWLRRRLLDAAAEAGVESTRLRPAVSSPDDTDHTAGYFESPTSSGRRRWLAPIAVGGLALLVIVAGGVAVRLAGRDDALRAGSGVTVTGPSVVAIGEQTWFAAQGPEGTEYQWSLGQGGFQPGSTFSFVPDQAGAGRLRVISTTPDGRTDDNQRRFVAIATRPVVPCDLVDVALVAEALGLEGRSQSRGPLANDCTYELRQPDSADRVFVTFRWHRAESAIGREHDLASLPETTQAPDGLLVSKADDTTTIFEARGSGVESEGVELVVPSMLGDGDGRALVQAIHDIIEAAEPPLRPSLQVEDSDG